LVVALDVSFRADEQAAADAGRGAGDGLGGECHPAMVLDARGGGEERGFAARGGAPVLPLAGGGGQQRAAAGSAETIGRREGVSAERRGGATGIAADLARFLRSLECAVRALPVSGIGARLGWNEVGGTC